MKRSLINRKLGKVERLLHGPFANAAHWLRVIPGLAASHRVIAPDLPGHGDSRAPDDGLTAERTVAWLGELIAQTCASPPVLVGQTLGGAIAARFAVKEAVAKALATGWSGGFRWKDVEVENDPSGKPAVILHGRVKELLRGNQVLVSISHAESVVVAAAVIEGPAR